MTKEQIFEIIDEELEKRNGDTFLLWDFPNDVKKRIEELDKKEKEEIVKVRCESKINWLNDMKQRSIFLNESCKSCLPDEDLAKTIAIIDSLIEDAKRK